MAFMINRLLLVASLFLPLLSQSAGRTSPTSSANPKKAIAQSSPVKPNAMETEDGGVLFEGYSKILNGGVHIGYIVSRYEFRPKDQKFYSIYYLKTGPLGSDITESLQAVANQKLEPISYQYTSIVGKEVKTIDAKFKNRKMTAIVKTTPEKGPAKVVTVSEDLPQGSILRTFLVYLMLGFNARVQPYSEYNADLYKYNAVSKYEYTAVAEEDAKVITGEALVGIQEKFNGFQTAKIFNRFKDARFVSYVTNRGEVLATSSPATGVSTELVAKAADATGNFPVSAAILKNLFKEVPLGLNNAVAKKFRRDSMVAPPEPPNPKQEGVPQKQGIVIKATTDNSTKSESKQSPQAPAPPENTTSKSQSPEGK